MKSSFWDRDLVPEFLWVGALRELVPLDDLHKPHYALMDALDSCWRSEEPAIGMISEFGDASLDRAAFVTNHAAVLRDVFLGPFGRLLAFYPDSPASWLVSREFLDEGGHLDPGREIPILRNLVTDLLDPRGELATAVRMVALGRLLKGGRMLFPRDFPLASLLPKYPDGCTADERAEIESFGRAAVGAHLSATAERRTNEWARYFWRHNYDLTPCRPRLMIVAGGRPAEAGDLERLQELVGKNTEAARSYIDRLAQRIAYDLYEPEQGEVLHGLFARTVRLYLLVCENPSLWARDVAGILLRCLVETAITFCYLAARGESEDFRRFREYGEAQKKLLMLHLQDSHPDAVTLEGRTSEDISAELGGFSAELLHIELGNWSKLDARKLAKEAGLEEYYRLIFTPTSADIHGTWASLKDSNLSICSEVLHRFHRLPTYAEPPLFVATLEAAQAVLRRVHAVAVERLRFPPDLVLEGLLDEQPEPDEPPA
ncbi:MAG: hypothetical protein AMXMBFR36_08570 [Acidobacteriota bacterium]